MSEEKNIQGTQNNNDVPNNVTQEVSPNAQSNTQTRMQSETQSEKKDEGVKEISFDELLNALPEEERGLLPDNYLERLKEKGFKSEEEVKALIREDLNILKWHQSYQQQRLMKISEEWVKQAKEDPEIGRQNFEEALGIAKKGLKAFATQPLIDFLDSSGLGNHPEVIRLFYKIGQLIKDDSITVGAPTTGAKKSLAEILYNNSGN